MNQPITQGEQSLKAFHQSETLRITFINYNSEDHRCHQILCIKHQSNHQSHSQSKNQSQKMNQNTHHPEIG